MTYFYRIGACVLASDQEATRYECTQNGEFRSLTFNENTTVSAVEPGDTYEPDNKKD